MHIVELIYLIALSLLALYGLNALALSLLYLHHRCQRHPTLPLDDAPPVTVQLPIYNEAHVVRRLIDSVAALDYPLDRLEVQVLDDSTDETTSLARERIAFHRTRGVDITLIHRRERTGFKAGALAEGLGAAHGEFIAIFDADFLPPPNFLRHTIPHFLDHPRLGLIQTRWGHLNATDSPLTRAQAMILDGHFGVEHPARNRNGLPMNFNGSAGVWRRSCIEEAGGWRGEAICEDMDLSYRAQLAGWKFLYLPSIQVLAELPPQIHAFKRQQFRWAKGATQCLLRLGPRLLRAPIPLTQRIEGLLHLSGYMIHPLMLILMLLTLPLLWEGIHLGPSVTYLGLAGLGPILLFTLGQRALYPDWPRRLLALPLVILIGTGIAVNNTWALVEALTGRESPFQRTPKFCLESSSERRMGSPHTLSRDRRIAWAEMGAALYALTTIGVAWMRQAWGAIPFLLIYLASFAYVGSLSLGRGGLSRTVPSLLKELKGGGLSATYD
ncbi:MAG: glycosyltransferase [Chloroflexota bacterium]|nr:glycosyltransferase [Chloroflexota bacterium]